MLESGNVPLSNMVCHPFLRLSVSLTVAAADEDDYNDEDDVDIEND